MNGIVNFRLCTLTDQELVEAVDKATDEMYKTLDVPTRHIPARPNSDFDLLVGELVQRFIEAKGIPISDTKNISQQGEQC